ncbi:MAG: hypothetical protein NZL89_00105 [Leptospiraceae bacterium]|nr:hypothetical protein [Leptospiraceae bacterium]
MRWLYPLCSIVLTSCAGFDKAILQKIVEIDSRYAGYEVFVNTDSLKATFPDSHYDVHYRESVREMILNRLRVPAAQTRKGYISVIVREVKVKDERGWLLGLITVIPALLGLPYQRINAELALDVAIMDLQGKIVKVFTVEGRYEVPNGLYYGHSDFRERPIPADTPYAKTAIFNSLDRALIDAKIQLAYLASRLEYERQ